MCRLLGVVAATAAPIADLVPAELPRLEALSEVHSHGWGVADSSPRGRIGVTRAPQRAGASDDWRAAVAATRTNAALLHIRQASPGMPHTVANTHPFVADGVAFAHNGHAHPQATLDALVVDLKAPAPVGDTDSERYFALVRAGLLTRPPAEALLDAARHITAVATYTSLNALLLTPHELVAIAWWSAPGIQGAGDGETERDYRLWYQVASDRVVIASAGVAGAHPEWSELAHGHALTVDRESLALRIIAQEGVRSAA